MNNACCHVERGRECEVAGRAEAAAGMAVESETADSIFMKKPESHLEKNTLPYVRYTIFLSKFAKI